MGVVGGDGGVEVVIVVVVVMVVKVLGGRLDGNEVLRVGFLPSFSLFTYDANAGRSMMVECLQATRKTVTRYQSHNKHINPMPQEINIDNT